MPNCIDELVDWCREATKLEHALKSCTRASELLTDEMLAHNYIPFVHRELVHPTQTRCFGKKSREFNQDNVLIIVAKTEVTSDAMIQYDMLKKSLPAVNDMKTEVDLITLSEFSTVIIYLRRLELLFLSSPKSTQNEKIDSEGKPEKKTGVTGIASSRDDHQEMCKSLDEEEECMICMDDVQQIVLPCTHGFCSRCAKFWVEAHMDCPVCRRNMSRNEFRREQWQLETWTDVDVAEQICAIKNKMEAFWTTVKSTRGRENRRFNDDFMAYTRAVKTIQVSQEQDDEFVVIGRMPL